MPGLTKSYPPKVALGTPSARAGGKANPCAPSDTLACGLTPMLAPVETALVRIGVPADRILTERFDWV